MPTLPPTPNPNPLSPAEELQGKLLDWLYENNPEGVHVLAIVFPTPTKETGLHIPFHICRGAIAMEGVIPILDEALKRHLDPIGNNIIGVETRIRPKKDPTK